jgi:hypothetical protein
MFIAYLTTFPIRKLRINKIMVRNERMDEQRNERRKREKEEPRNKEVERRKQERKMKIRSKEANTEMKKKR